MLKICLLLGGLYQYFFSIYGHVLYSNGPGTAEGLIICKMCDMHIFYPLKEWHLHISSQHISKQIHL